SCRERFGRRARALVFPFYWACITARRSAERGVTERLGSSSTQARERLRNPRWGVRALVHPLHELAQARQGVEQHVLLQDRRHVERVCRYKVGHRHVVTDEELPAVHVFLQDRRHVEEVLTGDRYLRREPLLGWVERSVSRDSPERLFQLGRGEEEPSVDLGPGSKPAGEQAFLRVLLRQVEDDRDRLRENEVAIDEDRQLSGRVHGEKLGPPKLALGGVYVDELELDIQLAQRPEDADRTGRREPIELHGVAVSFCPEHSLEAAHGQPWVRDEVAPSCGSARRNL